MKQAMCSISSNAEIAPGIHLMWIEAPDMAAAAQPGQFITVRCGDFTLRRPFSIHQSSPLIREDPGEGEIAILFKVTGKGTLWLSQRKAGEKIDILGPLGKGFTIEQESRNLLLVAGGIGLAPLVFLMQQASSQHQITLIQGASTAAQLCPNSYRLSAVCCQRIQFVPVTEDGSTGQRGKVTDVLTHYLDWADQVYACGPVGTYQAMARTLDSSPLKAEEKSEGEKRSKLKLRECQVSLEVRMGCGFGACYGCTINTKKGLKQVCRDGPVFRLDDIMWQEVRT